MTMEDGQPGPGWPAPDARDSVPPASGVPAPEPVLTNEETIALRPRSRPRRPWPFGIIALSIAAALVVAEGVAVYLASSGQPAAATVLGQVLVVATALPLALGLLAAIRNHQRGWGLAAMVVSVVANPFILVNLLAFFGSM